MFVRFPVFKNLTKNKVLSVEELTTSETEGLEDIGACDSVTAGWMASTDEAYEIAVECKQPFVCLGRM